MPGLGGTGHVGVGVVAVQTLVHDGPGTGRFAGTTPQETAVRKVKNVLLDF